VFRDCLQGRGHLFQHAFDGFRQRRDKFKKLKVAYAGRYQRRQIPSQGLLMYDSGNRKLQTRRGTVNSFHGRCELDLLGLLTDLKHGQQQFPGKFIDLAGVFVVSAIIRGSAPGIKVAVFEESVGTRGCDFQANLIRYKKQHFFNSWRFSVL
jgi:hypothetical protein